MPPPPGRGGRVRRPGLPLAACLAATLLVGCTAGAPPESAASPTSPTASTPDEARIDLGRLPVPRASLCHQLDDDGVAQALGTAVSGTAHYDNGEAFEVAPGRVDISHEHGCVFEGADGSRAAVWVFARPVSTREARRLVRRARTGRRCAFPGSVGFTRPGLVSVCEVRGPDTRLVRARLEGLFVDTWVGCEVSDPLAEAPPGTPRQDVLMRAQEWCIDVVTTAGARP